jgi:hypothetical protein
MTVTTALLLLALGCAGCGQASSSRTGAPLAVSASRHLCPTRDLKSEVLDKAGTLVLVPGHPSALLICRYGSLEQLGLPGALAGALSVRSPSAVDHLATEFDALRHLVPGPRCPRFVGRSELFIFRYPNARPVPVRLSMDGCIPVTNGRVVRDGRSLHLAGGAEHWPDQSLL